MEKIKSYTDLEQSNKLAEILPLESADIKWFFWKEEIDAPKIPTFGYSKTAAESYKDTEAVYIPCWSLAALLGLIKDKCGYFELVYLKRTSDSRENALEDVYRLSTDLYDVYKKEALDACVAMIEKFHELKMS